MTCWRIVVRKRPNIARPSRLARSAAKANDADEASVATVGPNDNIFAALDVPDAEEWLAKAELARAIQRHTTARRMTQMQAAVALGGAQSDISNLARGRLAGYSIERLCRFLNALGQDVRIVVQPKPRTRRQATVRAMVLRTA